MGLPIQGFVVRGGKQTVDLEGVEREVDRARAKAEIGRLERGEYRGTRAGAGDGAGEGDAVGNEAGVSNAEDDDDDDDDGRRNEMMWTIRERLENQSGFRGMRRGVGG